MNRADFERWCRLRRSAEPDWLLASAVARWLLAESGDVAVALAGFALAQGELRGDSRIDLEQLAGAQVQDGEPLGYPALADWLAALDASGLIASDGVLVLVERRWLYWRRLFAHEQAIRTELERRIAVVPHVPADTITAAVAAAFGPPMDANDHDQRAAVAAALGRPLFVLTGGPGTGKTHTLARLIKAWRHLAGPSLRVALAAPTGKAARRISEALANAFDSGADAVAECAQPPSHTLHRLLGWQPGRQMFRHHADNPLALDLLIVDEASMIDLGLMRRLLAALSPATALVLVGDAGQLSPVEVGSVFADIDGLLAARQHPARFRLGHNFRADQALAEAAEAVQSGDAAAFFASLARHPERIRWLATESASDAVHAWQTSLRDDAELPFDRWCVARISHPPSAADADPLAVTGRTPYGRLDVVSATPAPSSGPCAPPQRRLDALATTCGEKCGLGTDPTATDSAFHALGGARILAAPRLGAGGVLALNQRFERLLRARARKHGWPPPLLPIMVTENLPALGLANGDIGIAESAEPGAALVFPAAGGGGGYRIVPRAALGHLESGAVLTVHKAQGSEFDQLWLLLPAADSPLLSRQWLYTALTRARQQITVFGSRAALLQAINTSVQRASGLADGWPSP